MLPRSFRDLDLDLLELWHVSHKMPREPSREGLDILPSQLLRQNVHRVLHGVGRQNVAVVAARVGRAELTFKEDLDVQLADFVPGAVSMDVVEANACFAVCVKLECCHYQLPRYVVNPKG